MTNLSYYPIKNKNFQLITFIEDGDTVWAKKSPLIKYKGFWGHKGMILNKNFSFYFESYVYELIYIKQIKLYTFPLKCKFLHAKPSYSFEEYKTLMKCNDMFILYGVERGRYMQAINSRSLKQINKLKVPKPKHDFFYSLIKMFEMNGAIVRLIFSNYFVKFAVKSGVPQT